MSDRVKIIEVGPRDGLQNESKKLSVEDRVEFIRKLVAAGLKFIEGGSFVSPKAIPQMEHSDEVWKASSQFKADLSFLVPNEKGLDAAIQAGVHSISFFSATSDTFNEKNIRRNVDDSMTAYEALAVKALEKGLKIRGYVSTAFGCPYEGKQSLGRLVEVCRRFFEMGCEEVSVGDTIGVAHPKQVRAIFRELESEFGLDKIAAHLHDTRGAALANIFAALELGIRIFDSSLGGLGGCPYAKGASGNVATEEVVWLMEGQGMKSGIDIQGLLQICAWVEEKVQRKLGSKLYLSGPKTLFYF